VPLDLSTAPYELSLGKDIVSYSLSAGGLEIRKGFILHNSRHDIELRLTITNKGSAKKLIGYRLVGGSGIIEPNRQDRSYVEVTSMINGVHVKFKPPKGKEIVNPGLVSWTAVKNKYFSMILVPSVATKSQFYQQVAAGQLLTGVEVQDFELTPGASADHKYLFYAGPSTISELKSYNLGLETSVDYGAFDWISKLCLNGLKLFYGLFRNWGVAVICLSLLLNVILFPLTYKSFKSMQAMQALQPHIVKLKDEHKDNPQKMNKEMMELYKKHKVNPFGGCLPILLQMPIFIALYQALSRAIELKDASFLWIKDLSLPDAVNLPVVLPIIGNSVNILPLLMVLAMVIQQKLSSSTMSMAQTPEQAQQQRMMMVIMPVMFGFIFYNMPSGLVLYWLTNTVLMAVEQVIMFKRVSTHD
jgi:YidC/Oxa1 family membrane protein insertase